MSITIKQAFEKLAMVTGAAVKNPWFVGRNLNQAFADIADNIEGGGGSTVVVEPVLTEGTKIATITVDGSNTDLYAPAGGGGGGSHTYSTDEQEVGTWVDNTPVYEKTISLGSVGTDADLSVAHGITNLGRIVSFDCIAYSGTDAFSLPYTNYISSDTRRISIGASNIVIYHGNSSPAFSNIYIVLRYTKSTT